MSIKNQTENNNMFQKVRRGETYTAAAVPEANSHRREQNRDQNFAEDFAASRHVRYFRLKLKKHRYRFTRSFLEIALVFSGSKVKTYNIKQGLRLRRLIKWMGQAGRA